MKLPALHLSIYETEPLTANHIWPAAMTFPVHHNDKLFKIYNDIPEKNMQLVILPVDWEIIKPFIKIH
ncbi:hypothetical protein [Vibrio salinus]|uniref:hypothetical protein n=1 Tax=Vibrio salinus TaxID=2899784 RepID=UPI001E2ADF39|nr:hypothetical protein [Vibrio salinus]MCE0494918.1 hypothetical protein [Vibrio salinus]